MIKYGHLKDGTKFLTHDDVVKEFQWNKANPKLIRCDKCNCVLQVKHYSKILWKCGGEYPWGEVRWVITETPYENMWRWFETENGNFCESCIGRMYKAISSVSYVSDDGTALSTENLRPVKAKRCKCGAKLLPRHRLCKKCKKINQRNSNRRYRASKRRELTKNGGCK